MSGGDGGGGSGGGGGSRGEGEGRAGGEIDQVGHVNDVQCL